MNNKSISKPSHWLHRPAHAIAVLTILLCFTACTPSSGTSENTPQSVEAFGKTIHFSNPEGYCKLGESATEKALLENSARAIAPTDLLHMSAPCAELKALANGRTLYLNHWIQLQLLGDRQTEISREEFLSMYENELKQELQKLANLKLKQKDFSIETNAFDLSGRDDHAVYMSVSGKLKMDNGKERTITGMGATTMINELPVTIAVYEGTEKTKSRENLPVILQGILQEILASNPD